jgi:tetratricopeptide (TPR) repeat protein
LELCFEYWGSFKYDAAILKLQQVIRAEDNSGRAHISLGIAYKRNGLKDSAKTELQKGIDILTKYNDEGQFDTQILQAEKELQAIK